MRYQQLLEGRDAPLYHATNIPKLIEILHSNQLNASSSDRDELGIEAIRLTRDWNQVAKVFSFGFTGGVIALDQRKLNYNYKIEPWHFRHFKRSDNKSEAEEVIKTKNISPLDDYIHKVYVNKPQLESIIEDEEKLDDIIKYDVNDPSLTKERFVKISQYLLKHAADLSGIAK